MTFVALPFENLKAGQLIFWTNHRCTNVLFKDVDDVGIVASVDKQMCECDILWFLKPEIEGKKEVFYGEWFDENQGRIFSLDRPVRL